jgi:ammonium transporter, Amt family
VAVAGTLIALKVTEMVTPLRIGDREESTGMDLTLHGEEGYNLEV